MHAHLNSNPNKRNLSKLKMLTLTSPPSSAAARKEAFGLHETCMGINFRLIVTDPITILFSNLEKSILDFETSLQP